MKHDARCNRCGEWYAPGDYGYHSRGLHHQRALREDRKMRRLAVAGHRSRTKRRTHAAATDAETDR